jgi:hypothetical protein
VEQVNQPNPTTRKTYTNSAGKRSLKNSLVNGSTRSQRITRYRDHSNSKKQQRTAAEKTAENNSRTPQRKAAENTAENNSKEHRREQHQRKPQRTAAEIRKPRLSKTKGPINGPINRKPRTNQSTLYSNSTFRPTIETKSKPIQIDQL